MSKYADIEQIEKTIRDEWVKYMPSVLDMNLSFVLGKVAEVPTIEVSEDCITREVAIDIIKNYDFEFPEYMKRFVNELRDAMKKDLVEDIINAPSVVPSRRSEK